jgi:acetyl esterase/lipase
MQFDPLRDEGIAYAQALLAAGITVELHLFSGTFHGSMLIRDAPISKREADEAIVVLRSVFGGSIPVSPGCDPQPVFEATGTR